MDIVIVWIVAVALTILFVWVVRGPRRTVRRTPNTVRPWSTRTMM